MKLYVKNMVCPRCISAVEKTLSDINVKPIQVILGEITIDSELTDTQTELLKQKLELLGFELLDDTHKLQIEKIKLIIINHIHHLNDSRFFFQRLLQMNLTKSIRN